MAVFKQAHWLTLRPSRPWRMVAAGTPPTTRRVHTSKYLLLSATIRLLPGHPSFNHLLARFPLSTNPGINYRTTLKQHRAHCLQERSFRSPWKPNELWEQIANALLHVSFSGGVRGWHFNWSPNLPSISPYFEII